MNTNPTRHVKIAIIGAGTAGQSAFKSAQKHTQDLIIINDGFWTTTCATLGCMPSKLLIAAAKRAFYAQHSGDFGIHTKVKIDGKAVMARVQNERNRFAGSVQKQVDSWDDSQKIAGRAQINEKGQIIITQTDGTQQTLTADKIIIATGSKSVIPDGWREKLSNRLLTSDTIFELPDLPKSLTVIGAGVIALELAEAFARLGVEVTVLNRSSRLAGIDDPKINEKALDYFLNHTLENFNLKTDSQILEVAQNQDQSIITYRDQNGQTHDHQSDFILVAMGRKNQLDQLGLHHLGVKLDQQNRPKNWNAHTGQIEGTTVYIVGDAAAQIPLLHVANDEGWHAGQHAATDDPAPYPMLSTHAVPLGIIFTEPQIASVGAKLSELQKSDVDFVIGEISFDNQGRSRVMGENYGLLRIYAEKPTRKILGISLIAPDAEYIAHLFAMAISNQLTLNDFLKMPFYHPTLLEGVRTAIRRTLDECKKG